MMLNVLIADDEEIIREGLKFVVDWNKLGFSICGEASDGDEALKKIIEIKPDLVLLDIRMPNLLGTEIVQLTREQNYNGHFIILSGYSDFKYAQTAIHYSVDSYLIKPIDEDELYQAVNEVKNSLLLEQQNSNRINQYREKAKLTILRDILLNNSIMDNIDLDEINLTASVYQVIIYKNYSQETHNLTYSFADLLKVSNQGNTSFEYANVHQMDVILLKGDFALKRFKNILKHYEDKPQKGSPLDSLFISYGRLVYKPEDIHFSYKDALNLLDRRFFCEPNQHTIGFEQSPDFNVTIYRITPEETKKYCDIFCYCFQSNNRNALVDALSDLEKNLFHTQSDISEIKIFLADIYLQVKQTIQRIYRTVDIPFPTNSLVINYINNRYYLYEIIQFFSEQFDLILNSVGDSSNGRIWDDIINYIHINCHNNLRIENIAPLFGYNCSYFGKIFSKKFDCNFNTYLDHVRIEKSKQLLLQENLKVYEVAEKSGYKNVDYFHKKFKKYVGETPAEFRKRSNFYSN